MNEPPRTCDTTEHRWGQRVPLRLSVRLEWGDDQVGGGVLRDISLSGAFIETAPELPVFTNLVVGTSDFDGQPFTHQFPACVMRREAAGLAVEWRDMACQPLIELLERASGRHADNLCEDEAFAARRIQAR